MKLIICRSCFDVFSLNFDLKTCSCGESSGYYSDRRNAVITGPVLSLAIGNESLRSAAYNLSVIGKDRDRDQYLEENRVICWIRPNFGPGNPHTTYEEE